jgi:hypothetical protein
MFFMKYERSDLPDLPRWLRRLLRWRRSLQQDKYVPLLPLSKVKDD